MTALTVSPRARRALQRAVLIVPMALGYRPASAEHPIRIDYSADRKTVEAGAPVTFGFFVESACGDDQRADIDVGTSGLGGYAHARVKRSCGDVEATMVITTDTYHRTLPAAASDSPGLFRVTVPRRLLREGQTIRYWFTATQRRCDADVIAGYFVFCVPPAMGRASPERCHWAEGETPVYRLRVVAN